MAAKTDTLLRIERELGLLVHRVRRRTIHYASAVHPDLLPAAMPVLLFVVDHEGVRASDVVDHFGIDKGGVSRHVAHLESLGLLARACDPADGRAQTLVPTGVGRARIAEVRAARRRVVAGRLEGWSAAELEAFADQLSRYNTSLEG